jgi:Secretion system C-terminal sorting domain
MYFFRYVLVFSLSFSPFPVRFTLFFLLQVYQYVQLNKCCWAGQPAFRFTLFFLFYFIQFTSSNRRWRGGFHTRHDFDARYSKYRERCFDSAHDHRATLQALVKVLCAAIRTGIIILERASVRRKSIRLGWTTISDGRFKQNVQENVPGLALIQKLRPVMYTHKTAEMNQFLGIPDSISSKLSQNSSEIVGKNDRGLHTDYNYLDADLAYLNAHPSGTFYRLKMIDFDGSDKFSAIRTVYFGQKSTFLTIFPNPTSTETTVEFSAFAAGEENLQVFDVLGQLVFSQKTEVESGLNRVKIPANEWVKGTYFVKIGTSNAKLTVLGR